MDLRASPPSPPYPPPPPSRETDVAFGLILIMLGIALCVYTSIALQRKLQSGSSYAFNYTPRNEPDQETQRERILPSKLPSKPPSNLPNAVPNIPPTELIAMPASGFPMFKQPL